MPSAAAIAAFAGASVVFLAIPGPAVTFIVARSIEHGRRVGIAAAVGVDAGILVHVLFAVVGLSAVLASSAVAFTVVKLAGAAYLIVIGIRTLLSRDAGEPNGARTASSVRRAFRQGFVVNVLNPKTALFFLAFLPQFVDPARGSETMQLLALGVLFFAMALVSDCAYAIVAGTAAGLIRRRRAFRRARKAVTGSTYIGLGIVAATRSRA